MFDQSMKKSGLTDSSLCAAISEMEEGLMDADLGGHLYKKRVSLPGRGKSGSTRTLIATNKGDKWFFVFGFEKNEKGNISKKEKEALQNIAKDLLGLAPKEIETLKANQAMKEICNETQD